MSKEEREYEQQQALKRLKQLQKSGKVVMVPCNIDPTHKISEQEEDDYVALHVTELYQVPGAKSYANVSKLLLIHANQFERFYEAKAFALYDEVKLVHDPREDAPSPATYVFSDKPVDVMKTTASPSEKRTRQLDEQMQKINEGRVELDTKTKEIDARSKELDAKTADANDSFEKRVKALQDREAEIKRQQDELALKMQHADYGKTNESLAPNGDADLSTMQKAKETKSKESDKSGK